MFTIALFFTDLADDAVQLKVVGSKPKYLHTQLLVHFPKSSTCINYNSCRKEHKNQFKPHTVTSYDTPALATTPRV